MLTIQSSDQLQTIIDKEEVVLTRRLQKNGVDFNYYFTPSLRLVLYGAKVFFIDRKFIVFSFEKERHLSLLSMLERIHKLLIEFTRRQFPKRTTQDVEYPFFSIQNDVVTIRCSLPQTKNGYTILHKTPEGEELPFTFPRKGVTVDRINIDFKNLWENRGRLAYNLELKEYKL